MTNLYQTNYQTAKSAALSTIAAGLVALTSGCAGLMAVGSTAVGVASRHPNSHLTLNQRMAGGAASDLSGTYANWTHDKEMANRGGQGRTQAKNPNVKEYNLSNPEDVDRYMIDLYLEYKKLAKEKGWPRDDKSANAWCREWLAHVIELSQK